MHRGRASLLPLLLLLLLVVVGAGPAVGLIQESKSFSGSSGPLSVSGSLGVTVAGFSPSATGLSASASTTLLLGPSSSPVLQLDITVDIQTSPCNVAAVDVVSTGRLTVSSFLKSQLDNWPSYSKSACRDSCSGLTTIPCLAKCEAEFALDSIRSKFSDLFDFASGSVDFSFSRQLSLTPLLTNGIDLLSLAPPPVKALAGQLYTEVRLSLADFVSTFTGVQLRVVLSPSVLDIGDSSVCSQPLGSYVCRGVQGILNSILGELGLSFRISNQCLHCSTINLSKFAADIIQQATGSTPPWLSTAGVITLGQVSQACQQTPTSVAFSLQSSDSSASSVASSSCFSSAVTQAVASLISQRAIRLIDSSLLQLVVGTPSTSGSTTTVPITGSVLAGAGMNSAGMARWLKMMAEQQWGLTVTTTCSTSATTTTTSSSSFSTVVLSSASVGMTPTSWSGPTSLSCTEPNGVVGACGPSSDPNNPANNAAQPFGPGSGNAGSSGSGDSSSWFTAPRIVGIAFGALALLTLVVLVVVDKVRKRRELRAMTNASGPAVIATQRSLMRPMEDRGGYPQTPAARV